MTVTLRLPGPEDADRLFDAVRESIAELHPLAPWCPLTYSLADAESWIGHQPAAREAGTAFEFLVVSGEGRLRSRFLVHGQFQDVFVYSLIRPAPQAST